MKTKFNKLWIFILIAIIGVVIANNNNSKVYVVPIQNTIDLGIPAFVNRAVNAAENNDAELLVFEINTFGGRVFDNWPYWFKGYLCIKFFSEKWRNSCDEL